MRVLIAGANRGLGLALSGLFAEKGHTVYAGARREFSPELLRAAGEFPGLRPLELDVTDEAGAAKAAGEIAGALDAVIVVAGILPESDKRLLITDADIGDFRRTLEVNAVGSAVMAKHFHSLVRDGGMFVLVSSEAGSMTNVGAGYPGYSVSKAAQNKLAAILAKTVPGIRVYAIHPGRMNTDMGRENAQIEPEEAALGIFRIVSGETEVPPERGWFIDYLGQAMEI